MTNREVVLVVKADFYTLSFLVIAWVFWSWYDVIAYQDCGGTQNPMNLINILLGMAK